MHQLSDSPNAVIGLFAVRLCNWKVVGASLPPVLLQVGEEFTEITYKSLLPFPVRRKDWNAKRACAMLVQIPLECFVVLSGIDGTVGADDRQQRRGNRCGNAVFFQRRGIPLLNLERLWRPVWHTVFC